jgi:hypothetical protein
MIYLILTFLLMGLLILAAPLSLGYDSGEPWLRLPPEARGEGQGEGEVILSAPKVR